MFDKKSVFHSALVQATADGPLQVTILSDVLKSKFKRDGQDAYYISFRHNGKEHQYNVENDQCKNALQGLKGKTVELSATGSRDEAQVFAEVVGGSANRPPTSKPSSQRSEPPPRREPAGEDHHAKLKRAKVRLMRAAVAYGCCYRAAQSVVKEVVGAEMPADHLPAIASTFFIFLDRSGMIEDFPVTPKELASERPKPPPPEPEPEPEPEEPAEEDEIPF